MRVGRLLVEVWKRPTETSGSRRAAPARPAAVPAAGRLRCDLRRFQRWLQRRAGSDATCGGSSCGAAPTRPLRAGAAPALTPAAPAAGGDGRGGRGGSGCTHGGSSGGRRRARGAGRGSGYTRDGSSGGRRRARGGAAKGAGEGVGESGR